MGKLKEPKCSWCQDEKPQIEISLEDGKNILTLHLGASCFYQTITHAIGNPKQVYLNTDPQAEVGIVN